MNAVARLSRAYWSFYAFRNGINIESTRTNTAGRNAVATLGRTFSQITSRRVDYIPFGCCVILARFTLDRGIKRNVAAWWKLHLECAIRVVEGMGFLTWRVTHGRCHLSIFLILFSLFSLSWQFLMWGLIFPVIIKFYQNFRGIFSSDVRTTSKSMNFFFFLID